LIRAFSVATRLRVCQGVASMRNGLICLRDLAGINHRMLLHCPFTSLQASNIVKDNAHLASSSSANSLLRVREGCLRHLAATLDSIRLSDTQRQSSTLLPRPFSSSASFLYGGHDGFSMWQVRTAMAIASSLNRTLVMPQLWCGMDRWWAPHDGNIPGSSLQLPFQCPMDHIFDLEQ